MFVQFSICRELAQCNMGQTEVQQVLRHRNSKGPESFVFQASWEAAKGRTEWKAKNMHTKIIVKKPNYLLFMERLMNMWL